MVSENRTLASFPPPSVSISDDDLRAEWRIARNHEVVHDDFKFMKAGRIQENPGGLDVGKKWKAKSLAHVSLSPPAVLASEDTRRRRANLRDPRSRLRRPGVSDSHDSEEWPGELDVGKKS